LAKHYGPVEAEILAAKQTKALRLLYPYKFRTGWSGCAFDVPNVEAAIAFSPSSLMARRLCAGRDTHQNQKLSCAFLRYALRQCEHKLRRITWRGLVCLVSAVGAGMLRKHPVHVAQESRGGKPVWHLTTSPRLAPNLTISELPRKRPGIVTGHTASAR
jgi:hypothetical protein